MPSVRPDPPALLAHETENFWSKVNKAAPNGCWEWTDHTKPNGYGMFTVRRLGRKLHVHRLAFFLATGQWAALLVCHHCDNRCCVNPAHLFIGTQKENLQDMVHKGRSLTGDRNPSRLYPERRRGPKDRTKFSSNVSAALKKLYAEQPNKHAHGESHGVAKLTAPEIIEIRRLFAEGVNRWQIAAQFAIHRRQVYKIARREIWSHV